MKRMQTWILEIVEGRRNDFAGAVVRAVLFLLSLVYRVAVTLRNWAFDQGWIKSHSVDASVISIGNLTVGGTGKTPHVIWLAEQLQAEHEIAIVSRGYGSEQNSLNDEGMEIAHRLPDIIQVQNRKRILAAQQALAELKGSGGEQPLIIMDDGFQHRYLKRNLNIVLIDATNPFGHGHLLPRGLLREPLAAIRRADVAILTRSDSISPDEAASIQRQLQSLCAGLIWCETKLVVDGLQDTSGNGKPIDSLADEHVLAFCGIGNPVGFRQLLEREGIDVIEMIEFPDHHSYSQPDLQGIYRRARELSCSAVVCTQKDMVKISRINIEPAMLAEDSPTILSLQANVQFNSGQQKLLDAVSNVTGADSAR